MPASWSYYNDSGFQIKKLKPKNKERRNQETCLSSHNCGRHKRIWTQVMWGQCHWRLCPQHHGVQGSALVWILCLWTDKSSLPSSSEGKRWDRRKSGYLQQIFKEDCKRRQFPQVYVEVELPSNLLGLSSNFYFCFLDLKRFLPWSEGGWSYNRFIRQTQSTRHGSGFLIWNCLYLLDSNPLPRKQSEMIFCQDKQLLNLPFCFSSGEIPNYSQAAALYANSIHQFSLAI